jgi:hypothetical protein
MMTARCLGKDPSVRVFLKSGIALARQAGQHFAQYLPNCNPSLKGSRRRSRAIAF